MKKLTEKQRNKLELRIKLLLAAGLDYCKNTNKGKEYWLSPLNPYNAEAFGIIQALEVLDYGYFGYSNIDHPENLKFWFDQLMQEIKVEGIELGETGVYDKYRNLSC